MLFGELHAAEKKSTARPGCGVEYGLLTNCQKRKSLTRSRLQDPLYEAYRLGFAHPAAKNGETAFHQV